MQGNITIQLQFKEIHYRMKEIYLKIYTQSPATHIQSALTFVKKERTCKLHLLGPRLVLYVGNDKMAIVSITGPTHTHDPQIYNI